MRSEMYEVLHGNNVVTAGKKEKEGQILHSYKGLPFFHSLIVGKFKVFFETLELIKV